jgi:hypothetical protein
MPKTKASSRPDAELFQYVTAKLAGEDDCRQGWVISLDPLVIQGFQETYRCEGRPRAVINPPTMPDELQVKANRYRSFKKLYKGRQLP